MNYVSTRIDPSLYSNGKAAGYGEGPDADLPPVNGQLVQHPSAGTVLRIHGRQQFYMREAILIESTRRYFLYASVVDSSGVVFGIRWLDSNLRNLGSSFLGKPVTRSSRTEASAFVSRNGLCEGDIIPPRTAVYMRTKIRTAEAKDDVFIVSMGHWISSNLGEATSKISLMKSNPDRAAL
ncbi:hypothetical protein [Mesorhizobium sp. CN2-181]|uniref:hypothetical protein n=1 Tax=Mesorhizobium yinganensis TaxID=3157707 RepID=UPI0032B7BE3D